METIMSETIEANVAKAVTTAEAQVAEAAAVAGPVAPLVGIDPGAVVTAVNQAGTVANQIATLAQAVSDLTASHNATQATVTELTQLPGQVQTVAQIAVESQGILASLAPIFAKLKAAWAHIF
jgi:hypothetical protein